MPVRIGLAEDSYSIPLKAGVLFQCNRSMSSFLGLETQTQVLYKGKRVLNLVVEMKISESVKNTKHTEKLHHSLWTSLAFAQ